MTLLVEHWAITAVLIDPENERLFTRMDDSELDLLAASIAEVGIIQPLTIRADGRIIAGEQRYRAALRAGLTDVPVIVRTDLGEGEVERIRIHENLMRRGLKPSEQAGAIKRLYELNEIGNGGDRRSDAFSVTERNIDSRATVAAQLGWSEKRVSIYRTIANLILPLQRRWDAGELTRDVAYQVAQLDERHQYALADVFAKSDRLPNLVNEIAEYKREVVRIQQTAPLPPDERERLLHEEIAKLRLAHEREVTRLTFDVDTEKRKRVSAERKLEGAEQWAAKDQIHKTLGTLATLTAIDPATYVERLDGFDALTILLRADLEIAEGVQDWLRRYAFALRERLGVPQQRLKGVIHASVKETGTDR